MTKLLSALILLLPFCASAQLFPPTTPYIRTNLFISTNAADARLRLEIVDGHYVKAGLNITTTTNGNEVTINGQAGTNVGGVQGIIGEGRLTGSTNGSVVTLVSPLLTRAEVTNVLDGTITNSTTGNAATSDLAANVSTLGNFQVTTPDSQNTILTNGQYAIRFGGELASEGITLGDTALGKDGSATFGAMGQRVTMDGSGSMTADDTVTASHFVGGDFTGDGGGLTNLAAHYVKAGINITVTTNGNEVTINGQAGEGGGVQGIIGTGRLTGSTNGSVVTLNSPAITRTEVTNVLTGTVTNSTTGNAATADFAVSSHTADLVNAVGNFNVSTPDSQNTTLTNGTMFFRWGGELYSDGLTLGTDADNENTHIGRDGSAKFGQTGVSVSMDGSGNLTAEGTITGAWVEGDGSGLTSLNASELTSGTVSLDRLSGITSNQVDTATDAAYRLDNVGHYVKAGSNITTSTNGNEVTVSASAGTAQTNVTVIVPGSNVTVSTNTAGGVSAYTINSSASGSLYTADFTFTTTDDTTTNCYPRSIGSNTGEAWKVFITGYPAAGGTISRYELSSAGIRLGAGLTVDPKHSEVEISGTDINTVPDVVASSNDMVLQVTGAAAATWKWHVRIIVDAAAL